MSPVKKLRAEEVGSRHMTITWSLSKHYIPIEGVNIHYQISYTSKWNPELKEVTLLPLLAP